MQELLYISPCHPPSSSHLTICMGMNRLEANWNLVQQDKVTDGPGMGTGLDWAHNLIVKTHSALDNLASSITSPFNAGRFEVVDRTSPISGTINGIRNATQARIFPKGNPFNIAAKLFTAVTDIPGGMLSDVVHLGGTGKMVRQVA